MPIPRALRNDLQEDGSGQSQFIESRTIRPLSGWNGASQGRIEFQLPRQGILDRSSYIKLKVTGPLPQSRLPLWAGVYSMIETATLRIGGTEIQTRRGFGHLSTLKTFYRTPHDRNRRQSKRSGNFSGLMVDGTTTGGTNRPGHWGVDSGQGWADAPTVDTRNITTGYNMTNLAATTPEWVIDLATLFPILYSNSLPLGLLDDHINIILDLSPDLVQGQRAIMDIREGAVAWVAGTTVIEPSLHVDLIFFDDPIGEVTTMDKLSEELSSGEKLVFTDDQYITFNQPANTGAANLPVTNKVSLGCDNQIVRSVMISSPEAIVYTNPATSGNQLLGQYYSSASRTENSIQLTVNNQPIYPSPVGTDSEIWNELCQVMPTKFKMNSAIYSHFSQVNAATGVDIGASQRLTDKTLYGRPQTRQQGNGHYYGINLSKPGHRNVVGAGVPIGRNPVLLEITDTQMPNLEPGSFGKTYHIWVTTERLLSIVGGRVMVTGS